MLLLIETELPSCDEAKGRTGGATIMYIRLFAHTVVVERNQVPERGEIDIQDTPFKASYGYRAHIL